MERNSAQAQEPSEGASGLFFSEEDRRREIRIRYTVKVQFAWDEGDGEGYSMDISSTGVFLETQALLPLDTPLLLQIWLSVAGKTKVVRVRGHVVRTVSMNDARVVNSLVGMGIRFDRFLGGEADLRTVLEEQRRSLSSPSRLSQITGPTPATGEYRQVSQAGDPDRPHAETSRTPGPRREAPERGGLSGAERRRAPRVAVGLPVQWGPSDPPQYSGGITNISESGAFILHSEEELLDRGRIFMRFDLPYRGSIAEVRGIARVVRVVQDPETGRKGMGIAFDVTTVDVEVLRRFILNRLGKVDSTPRPLRPPAPSIASRRDPTDSGGARWRLPPDWRRAPRPAFILCALAGLGGGLVLLEVVLAALNAFG